MFSEIFDVDGFTSKTTLALEGTVFIKPSDAYVRNL